MSKFSQLLIYEMNRAKKFYLSLIASILGIEIIYILWFVWSAYSASRGEFLYNGVPSFSFGLIFSFSIVGILIVGIAIAAMSLYAVYTWVREWRQQDNFIYRLLLLPGKRGTLAYAKLASIMLMTFGLLSVQIIFVHLVDFGFRLISSNPDIVSYPYVMVTGSPLDVVLVPGEFSTFILVYTIVFGFLAWIANVVIGYFSFRSQGVVITIGKVTLYICLSIAVVLSVSIFLMNVIWIGTEIKWALGIFAIVWTGGHLSFMHYLMKYVISI